MFRIIKFLFTGIWKQHEHNWEIMEEGTIYKDGTTVVGKMYILKCSTCGEIKSNKCF